MTVLTSPSLSYKESIQPKEKGRGEVVVSIRGVSKKFCKKLRRSMAYGIIDLTKNLVGQKPDSTTLRKDEFWALDDVSFELRKGETLGLIGVNGSGKTTLLRLLTGIFPPDKGEIMIKGRVGALVAIGAGFHPHMTGRENIYLNGTILGLSRKEIDSKFQEIVDFAEIGDFLDAPVSTYSSGMKVRLGFAVAIMINPDILLIDEVLAVGDLSFKRRCFQRITELQNNGTAILLVSHNIRQILRICNRAVMLDKGRIAAEGEPKEVALLYYDKCIELAHLQQQKMEKHSKSKRLYVGTGEINVPKVKVVNYSNQGSNGFRTGDRMGIEIHLEIVEPLESIIVGFSIYTTDFIRLFAQIYNLNLNTTECPFNRQGVLKCIIPSLFLLPGTYYIGVGIKESNNRRLYTQEIAAEFLVKQSKVIPDLDGLIYFEPEWKYESL